MPRVRTPTLAVAAALLAAPASRCAPPPPDVVLVLLDDVALTDLGCYGGTDVRTPHLDTIARDGRRYTRFYAHPVCTPSRLALLTGTHPMRCGVRRSYSGRTVRGLPSHLPTVAEHLARRGYRTAHVGKWHLGLRRPRYAPTARGFERSVTDFLVSSDRTVHAGDYRDPLLFLDDEPGGVPHVGHRTECLVDHALRILGEEHDRPLFLNLWLHAPHAPHDPPLEWARRYPDSRRGRYAALLAHADDQIGRLVAHLERADRGRETLLLVAGDNGGASRVHPDGSLRGAKGSVDEGGLRVPLLARWPGRIEAGTTCEDVVHAVDVMPTLVALAGGDADALDVDGIDVSASLFGAPLPPRTDEHAFWETKTAPARDDDPGRRIEYAVRRGDWKLVRDSSGRRLHDLAADPGERRDRSADEPALAASLEEAYRRWRREVARIDLAPDVVRGDVRREGGGWRLDGPGEVRFAWNDLLDVGDGDFTLACRLTPAEVGGRKRTILHRGRVIRLLLDREGRVKVVVRGEGGRRAALRGSAPLVPGRAADVRFTVFGWKKDTSTLRLFVDGRLVDEHQDLDALAASSAPLVLGRTDVAARGAFVGRVESVCAHALQLDP